MTTVLQSRDMTDRTRALNTLGRIDYSDVATIEVHRSQFLWTPD
jgi:hypothetical protein